MTKEQRLRRVAKLCLHCVRNIAYYRERREDLFHGSSMQFWRTVDGNFIDICVLEWCKLFAEVKGKHHWKKVVTDKAGFFNELLAELECNEEQFDDYKKGVKTYRDKFVAHLDDENRMDIPNLDLAKASVFYLYEYLLAHEEAGNCFSDVPVIADYFLQSSEEARQVLGQQNIGV